MEDGGLLCLLSLRHDSMLFGVYVLHSFPHFQPATGAWRQALPSCTPSRLVKLGQRLERFFRTVSGRRYCVWRDDHGKLKAHADSTHVLLVLAPE